jgi:hypothetical protein
MRRGKNNRRAEHRLRTFENRVMMKIFGLEEQRKEWLNKLYNEKLYNLYSSPNIVRYSD